MTMGRMLQIQFAQKLGMLLHYSLTDRFTFKYILHVYKVVCVGSQAFRKKQPFTSLPKGFFSLKS